jgi:transcriptional regulator with XRE-family HTH domain
MKLNEALGSVLRELRIERRLTLSELSERSFVSLGHISDVERGAKSISSELLESLALALRTPSYEIVLLAGARMQLQNSKVWQSLLRERYQVVT